MYTFKNLREYHAFIQRYKDDLKQSIMSHAKGRE